MNRGSSFALGLCGVLLALRLFANGPARAAEPGLFVYDNDFFGAATTDILPLIGEPGVELLGTTVVTGDGWCDEEASYVLRALEIAGRSDIPVVKGAVFPLINSAARIRAWEAAYGRLAWKGAWNDPQAYPGSHPDDPYAITPDLAGAPRARASAGDAASFLIEVVHRHPHQVTVIAAGPLTNLALAIRLDPQFATLAKALVFMGGFVDSNLAQVTASANFATDFNMWFDPEAAHIVLTAPWARITSVGTVSNGIAMTPALKARIGARKTPVTELVVRYALDLPLWDELTTAVAVDPTLITQETVAYMDVDVGHGLGYGAAHVWPEATTPHLGEQKVHIVRAVDVARFERRLVEWAQHADAPHRAATELEER